MSPSRPKLTTSTAVTTRYPISSHNSRLVWPGWSGLTPMPRKISGSAISMIDALTVAISMPSVVLDAQSTCSEVRDLTPSALGIPPGRDGAWPGRGRAAPEQLPSGFR